MIVPTLKDVQKREIWWEYGRYGGSSTVPPLRIDHRYYLCLLCSEGKLIVISQNFSLPLDIFVSFQRHYNQPNSPPLFKLIVMLMPENIIKLNSTRGISCISCIARAHEKAYVADDGQ